MTQTTGTTEPRVHPSLRLRFPSFRLCWMLVAAVPLLLLPGCQKEAAPVPQVTVQAQHLQQGPISRHIVADAILAPRAQAAIEARITAPVKRFYVQRGARVKAGELLATLENSDLAALAQDNQGTYVAAQAAYNTTTQAQVPEDMQKAELDLAQARATLNLNRSIVEGRKQLFAQGAIPKRDLDTARAALVQTQAAYDTAAKHLQSLRNVSHKAALQAAKGQLTSAEGKFKNAEAQLSFSQIRSPISGYVTDRPLFDGETATAGTPLITIMDTSVLIAKTHVAQSLAQQMKLGDDATVSVPGLDHPVPAKVTLISPALDPGSTTVEVWLRIDNRTGALKVGTPVKVSITAGTVANASKIPTSAILTAQDGSKSVMVIGADSLAHRKPVTLGIEDNNEVQILGGLSPGDMVITSGAYGMDEGTRVKVGAAAAEDN
ncbi:MAG TPA: efflux RND transporter periplasmic adaptor subunit [Terracidiphilus sp.]|nr:efflux RND transporter periplasmic adaptor subunit [Terracidiphilus sp.]